MLEKEISVLTRRRHKVLIKQLISFVRTSTRRTKYLEEYVAEFIEHQRLRSNSRSYATAKTYLDSLLGALARYQGTIAPWIQNGSNNVGDSFIRKKGVVATLQRIYRMRAAQMGSKKGVAAQLRQVRKMTALCQMAFLVCGRMGDMVRRENRFWMEGTTLHIELRVHKTVSKIGRKTMSIKIPKKFSTLRMFLENEGGERKINPFRNLRKEATKDLKDHGLTCHSLRRGGAAFHYDNQVPVQKIRILSMHTTDEAFLRYIDKVDFGQK